MQTVHARFGSVDGNESALGWSGGHAIVADRPDGRAGGMGLGFNGAQLLALAIGGCFCNDLRYIAHRRGLVIATLAVDVALHLDGDPVMATAAEIAVRCVMQDGSDGADLVAEAQATSMVANTLMRGVPVTVGRGGA